MKEYLLTVKWSDGRVRSFRYDSQELAYLMRDCYELDQNVISVKLETVWLL